LSKPETLKSYFSKIYKIKNYKYLAFEKENQIIVHKVALHLFHYSFDFFFLIFKTEPDMSYPNEKTFGWKSITTNQKTYKYDLNQEQSHVPQKKLNTASNILHQRKNKEETHIFTYLYRHVVNIFSFLHGWLTEHQNSKTYLSLFTTFLTACNTKTKQITKIHTSRPRQLWNQQLCAKWTFLGTKQKHCFVSLFYPTLQFKLRIEKNPSKIPWPCTAEARSFKLNPPRELPTITPKTFPNLNLRSSNNSGSDVINYEMVHSSEINKTLHGKRLDNRRFLCWKNKMMDVQTKQFRKQRTHSPQEFLWIVMVGENAQKGWRKTERKEVKVWGFRRRRRRKMEWRRITERRRVQIDIKAKWERDYCEGEKNKWSNHRVPRQMLNFVL